jgi:transglutaminase-like putative cysteine protease
MDRGSIVVVGARGHAALAALLSALVTANKEQGRARGGLPALIHTNVRYRREPAGTERWQTANELLTTLRGDCEDLAAYEAARLQLLGVQAEAVIMPQGRQPSGRMLYHVVVVLPGGRHWDPSARLGMPVPARIRNAHV